MINGAQVPQPYPLGNTCPPVGSSRRHSSFLSFLPRYDAHIPFQNENFWSASKSYATGGENSLLLIPPVTVSRPCLTFIDSPELGPGTVLAASGSSVSVTATAALSSNTSTSIPVGGHSSNAGAVAGGIIGGIAAISILVAALLFYLRRRRSLTPTVVFEGDGARHMDQVQLPISDQGILAETLPETMPPLTPYVNVFVPLNCDYVSSCLLLTLRTRMTQRRTPSSNGKKFSHHRPTFLVKHLPYLPTEVYTALLRR